MEREKPQHEEHALINKQSNQLLVGGKTLAEIEMLVGQTPYYAYDRQNIKNRVEQLKQTLPKGIDLHYAIKANPYPAVVHYFAGLVDGFDVASTKEMLLAMQTSIPPNEISFAGPGKSDNDIASAIIAGITLHTESENELTRTIAKGKELGIKPNVAIRVNPLFELKYSGMKMSGGAKQFGIDEELLAEILSNIKPKEINLRGFHIYSGSQNLKVSALIEAQQKTFELAARLIKLSPVKIDYINIGGGIGIPYFPGEKSIDLTLIADNLQNLLDEYKKELQDKKIIMELGRFLVAEAGVYVCKVIDKKISRGSTYLICDGGLHHHLANSGNFGQVIRKNYPVAIGNKLQSTETEIVEIVGPLCTPLDVIANKVELPAADVGDYVVVFQSGAYGATASPQAFLSQPALSEILI